MGDPLTKRQILKVVKGAMQSGMKGIL